MKQANIQIKNQNDCLSTQSMISKNLKSMLINIGQESKNLKYLLTNPVVVSGYSEPLYQAF